MNIKHYPYKDIDGNHWPDAALGDALFYAIDYSQWLTEENDELVSIAWTVPAGLVGSDGFEANGQANIKLTTEKRGSHKVVCAITTVENGFEQKKTVLMILKVY